MRMTCLSEAPKLWNAQKRKMVVAGCQSGGDGFFKPIYKELLWFVRFETAKKRCLCFATLI